MRRLRRHGRWVRNERLNTGIPFSILEYVAAAHNPPIIPARGRMRRRRWSPHAPTMSPMTNHRDQALEYIRLVLFDQTGPGLVHVVFEGRRNHPFRLVWPEGRQDRLTAWGHLERLLLTACESSAQVKAKRDGDRRGRVAVMQWPAAPDLFEEVHPAPASPTAEPTSEVGTATGATAAAAVVPARRQPGEKASEECARHVLRVLFEEQRRLTGDGLADVMNTHSEVYPWSKRSIEHALAWLRGLQIVDNAADGRGRGYGLVNWSVDPTQDAE